MNNWKHYLLVPFGSLLLLGVIGLGSCRELAPEGPELEDIFGEFQILRPLTQDRTTVDFSAGETVEFIAELSVRTDWTLTIRSIETGARKIIQGNEKLIMGDVARWNGSVTFAPLFSAGEHVVASMQFAAFPDSTMFSDTILITGSRPLPEGGILVSDFENLDQVFEAFSEFSFEETNNGVDSLFPAAIGDKYWYMFGRDNNGSVFVCGLRITATSAQGTPVFEFPTENEEKVWFNMFVFGTGTANTVLVIDFQEDDNLNGTYVASQEGTYNYQVPIDWNGWRILSFPYSATAISTNGGLGNVDANGQREVNRIIALQFILLSAGGQSDNSVGFGLDQALFTINGPYEP